MRKINLSPRGISDKKFPIILNQKSKSRWRKVGTLFFPKIFFNSKSFIVFPSLFLSLFSPRHHQSSTAKGQNPTQVISTEAQTVITSVI